MKKLIKLSALQTLFCLLFATNLFAQVTVTAQNVLTEIFDCKKKTHSIDISNIVPGVYSVKIDFEKSKSKIIKLVIAR